MFSYFSFFRYAVHKFPLVDAFFVQVMLLSNVYEFRFVTFCHDSVGEASPTLRYNHNSPRFVDELVVSSHLSAFVVGLFETSIYINLSIKKLYFQRFGLFHFQEWEINEVQKRKKVKELFLCQLANPASVSLDQSFCWSPYRRGNLCGRVVHRNSYFDWVSSSLWPSWW
jgi:hypothetical protein